MKQRLQKLMKTRKTFLYLLGVIIITLSAQSTKAQITIDFNGAFPPPGPPVVSNPVGTGITDEGLVKWYRGDTIVVTNGSTSNAGINPGRGGAGFAASFNTWDINNGGKADLIINDVNLSTGYAPAAVLKFWMINTSGTDVIRVFARNGNDPWVQVGASTYSIYASFTEISISLQAFTGGSNTSVDIRFEGTSDYGSTNIGIDDISINPPSPMTYVSSVASQKLNDAEIFRPLPNQEIARIAINTSGTLSPLVPNTFYFNTTGTTSTANISNAKLWFTGLQNTLNVATATRVGNIVANPNGSFSITGVSQTLAEGSNFFFLTFDVNANATSNDTVDITFDSVAVGTSNFVPVVSNPVGKRIIRPATTFVQTPGSAATGSANGRGPSTGALFNRSISIYPASEIPELKNGQTISSLGFEIGGLGATPITAVGNIKIYLLNTSDAAFTLSTTFATAITGMTLVYDGPLTINPELGTYDIRLSSPYVYTGGNIYMAYDWAITSPAVVAGANSNLYACVSTLVGGGNGNRSSTGATAPTTLGTSAFRPKVRFGVTALANDAAISTVYTLTEMANPAANQHQVRAIIKNNGFNPLTNYNVNLQVSGANTFSNTKTVSLGFGESASILFDAYSNTTNGLNLVKVKVASDDNTTNDSLVVNQNVSATQFSYSDITPGTGALGFNTGAGMMLTKYKAVGAWLVDSVRISIANNPATNGKRLLAVVLNSAGTLIARSDTLTMTAGDLNTFKTFAIVSPKTVSNEEFYVGLSQIANATGYFPLGTQTESPARPGAYFTASSQGGGVAEANTFGRFPINAFVSPAGAPPVVNLGADAIICDGDSITLDAGNPGSTYLWSTGATTQTINVKTTGSYSVTVRDAQFNPGRDTITVTVNPILPVSVSIAQNPPGIVCSGIQVTFTATPVNGGTAPSYVWLVNGTPVPNETSATFTSTTLSNNDQVAAVLSSNEQCKSGNPDTSAAITMQISAGLAPVTVTAAPTTAGPYCAGSSISFVATPSNGGSTPRYRWFINNVVQPNDTLVNFTANGLNNNDTVKVELTSNSLCVSGSSIAEFKYGVSINPNLPVSVSVVADKDSICGGQSITFTATPTNGGTSPSYRWFRNGIVLAGQTAATLTTSIIENNDTIRCELTSNEICQSGGPALSNGVIAKVNPLPNTNFSSANTQRTVNFTNTTTAGVTYAWDFGDGGTSTAPNPSHTYAADGSFNVRLIASNACGSDTITKSVLVITVDANVTGLTAPVSGCNLTASTQVRIRVRNNRTEALTNVPVAYQINGGTVVTDIIPSIAASGLSIFTFTTNADLSADGEYNVVGWAAIPNDFDNSNDTFKVTVYNQSRANASFTTSVIGGDLTLTNTSTTAEGNSATTYAWSFGDGNTSTAENPTHTYAAVGTYTVQLIATNTCGSDTSSSNVTITAVGINNTVNAKNVAIYPNPNTGKFNVDLALTTQDRVTLTLINANGQIVYTRDLGTTSAENLSIDLSELAAGIYSLKIEGINTQITKRVSVVK